MILAQMFPMLEITWLCRYSILSLKLGLIILFMEVVVTRKLYWKSPRYTEKINHR